MISSIGQTTNVQEHPFGVLDVQVGEPRYNGHKPPIKFEDIPKPTELEPLKTPQVEQKNPVTEDILQQSVVPEVKTFEAPQELVVYVNKLIHAGRKLKALVFDIGFANSNDDVRALVATAASSGQISDAEKRDMLGFLKDIQTGSVQKREQNLALDPIKKEKLEKLKNDYGIIMG